jgi:hypothetical protein
MGNDPFSGGMEDEEWVEWQQLSMEERWRESMKLWQFYLSMGGSLAPEPDSQSPFYFDDSPGPVPADGRPGMRVVRRGPV